MNAPIGASLPSELSRNWGWLVAWEVLLLIVGTIGLGYSVLFTEVAVLMFGVFLLIGSGISLLAAFHSRSWSGFFLLLLLGLLQLISGIFCVANPLIAAIKLTVILAVFLILGGMLRLVVAVTQRFPHWGWSAIIGILSIAIGVEIWLEWPVSGLWFLGFLLALDLMFHGWTLVLLGLAARQSPRAATA